MGRSLLPTTDNERIAWADNFEMWFPQYGADVGFTAGEVTAAVNDAVMMRYVIESSRNAANHSKAATAYKNSILGGVGEGNNSPDAPNFQAIVAPAALTEAGVLGRLASVAGRIKAHPNYTDTLGEKLMIATPVSDAGGGDSTAKPNASATPLTGSVIRLDWTKSRFDGVFIDAQRADETVWARLDFDMRSPFEDSRSPLVVGKPEERRYRLIYFIDNQAVGVYSDVIVAITIP